MNVAFMEKNAILKKSNKRPGSRLVNIIFSNADYFRGYEFYLSENKRFLEEGINFEYKFIPCGKCIGCRAKQRKEWAIRIELEAKKYKNNYFVTLTYNPENITIPDEMTVINKDGSETTYYNDGSWQGTVVKEDLQKFIKRLRRQFEYHYNHTGTRFYACSEYGQNGTNRPHYHIILLNCPKLNLKPLKNYNPKTKDPYYDCDLIAETWGKGFITVGRVTTETINYTTGYCTKKLFGEVGKHANAKKGQSPIFASMSTHPGIGKEWWEANKNNLYENHIDEIINGKGNPIKVPSYFDRLMDIGEDEDYYAYQHQKACRELLAEFELEKIMKTQTQSLQEYYLESEEIAKDKNNNYSRRRIIEGIH